jgi:uncharacterized protein (TIGR02246 family)
MAWRDLDIHVVRKGPDAEDHKMADAQAENQPPFPAEDKVRFEHGIAMLTAYYEALEGRLAATVVLFVGVVGWLITSESARAALSGNDWLTALAVTTLTILLVMYGLNVAWWVRRWDEIRRAVDRLHYVEPEFYSRYDMPRFGWFGYFAPAALLYTFVIGCLFMISIGRFDGAGVERTTAAFHQALRSNDLEAFMSYVGDDVFFMPPGEPAVRGRDAVREWMTAFLTQYRTSSLTLAEREVLAGNDWAVELGTFEWALEPATGGAAVVDRGNYMQVWQRQADRTWRFAREVYNSSIPAASVPAK